MKSAERDKALEMRTKYQMGYSAIAKEVAVSKGTLSRWLKDLPLSPERILELRREAWGRGEASRELFRQTMRKRQQKREESVYRQQRKYLGRLSRQSLFVAGLMLYLAEGDKKDKYHIGLANTDPKVIKFFLWWLTEFLQVKKSDIRIQLHLYESMDLSRERRFWTKLTMLPNKQFYKEQVRPLRPGSFSYPESFRHGTCKIYLNGIEPTSRLMLSIRAFLDTYKGLRV